MKKIIYFSLTLLLLLPLSNSFGTFETPIGDDIFIFVQSTVRNSDGTLIVYLESEKFTDLNLPALKSFFDFEATHGSSQIITIDGEKYQVVRRMQSQSFDSDMLVASTLLSNDVDGKSIILARFIHDGYYVVPDDTLESKWTFVRSVS